jgi:hypothetical protein
MKKQTLPTYMRAADILIPGAAANIQETLSIASVFFRQRLQTAGDSVIP